MIFMIGTGSFFTFVPPRYEYSGSPNAPAAALTTVECLAPEQVARKQEIVDAADDGAIEKLAAAVKAAL